MLFATENHHDNYALPAEWAPQSAVQLTWPHENSDWNYCLDAITQTFVELVRAIVPFEPVLIVTPNVEQTRARLMADLSADLLTDLKFVQAASNDTWARDHALITLQGKNGNLFLNFCFNGWGEKFPSDLDNAINRRVFEAGILDGRMEEHADFVLEGGAIESDGKGTVFTTSQCLLAPRRNQPLGQKEIEQKLKEFLRADRIVWLDYGNLTGDDTDLTQESGELMTFDDNDQELMRCVVEQWIDNKDDDFYQAVAAQLKSCIKKNKELLDSLSILKPYSFVLEDDDQDTIEELYVVDDDIAIIEPLSIESLDSDLDEFLANLLKS